MPFPNDKKLKEIRKKLNSLDPTRSFPEDPSKAQVVKYKICEKFVVYLMENNMGQAELARKIDMDPARLNEIVKYKIDLFTIDKLLDYAENLDPSIEVKVA